MEIDDDELEQFVELWVERKSAEYLYVERIGAAHDKGRDVIGFLSSAKHEGPWHLYQCKRKTRGTKLGRAEGLNELGKVFYHHLQGSYRTLPTKYVFVSPRGIVGPLLDLINNPSTLGKALIDDWDQNCATRIVARKTIALTPELRAAIDGYDFRSVSHLTAPMIVKDPAARPALSRVLHLIPDHAPPGITPVDFQDVEIKYIEELRQVYEEASGTSFVTADQVLAHAVHGDHLRDQRNRFFEAASFNRFHRDNTAPEALVAFENDVYHGVIEVHRQPHGSRLERVDAVMKHASLLPVDLIGRLVRVPVKQGMCHYMANGGRITWVV